MTALTAVEVVDKLTSSVEVGSEEDQNTENLDIIADVLSEVITLINVGDFTANQEACYYMLVSKLLDRLISVHV